MKTRYFNLLPILFLCALALSSCKKKTKTENETVYSTNQAHTLQDVSYGSDNQQKMDVYLPKNRNASTKVFVLIHGGGWTAGDKSDYSYLFNNLKTYYPNHAIININYRLATSNSPAIPKQIDDIQAALNEIQKDVYGVSRNYFLFGASAGGHLALLYGYKYDSNKYVKGICNTVGPADLTDANYTDNTLLYLAAVNALVGLNQYTQNPQIIEQISPAQCVTPNSPPTISFYGDADELIPTTQMSLLHDQLTAKGVPNQCTMYAGEGHVGWSVPNTQDYVAKAIVFINTYFH